MMFLFGNLSARDARTIPGSARASRAVSGALAGNTMQSNHSRPVAKLPMIFTSAAVRRERRAVHTRRVRSPIL
jgi:hypothetical protein